MSDPYVYPGTNVLRNKLDIRDKDKLFWTEIEYTDARMLMLQDKPIKGNFNLDHLCRIHRFIFQDLYDWAGKIRTVNIAKNNMFCLTQHIQTYAETIFPAYQNDCMHAKNDKDKFIHAFTQHYADLNALHPFREGNGRAQREFARELCLQCGYVFNLQNTTHEQMLHASVLSLDREDNTELEQIFRTHICRIEEYRPDPRKELIILSKDDIPKKQDRGKIAEERLGIRIDAPDDDYQFS